MSVQFLYCISAAKAGTTWLARALRTHDQAVLPPIKETHYFDALENGTSIWALDQLIRVRSDVRAEMAAAKDDKTRKRTARRVQEIDRWLALVGAAHRLVADVTPAYALLKSDTYARMAALNNGQTRFLMILRDPIDRLWSNISMSVARRVDMGVGADAARAAILDEVTTGVNNPERARSDYAGTLARLEAAVPAEQRKVVFFEDLFQPKTLAALSDFLGLDTPLIGPDEKVNASTTAHIAPDVHARLSGLLRAQYDDVHARLGTIPQRWQDNLAQSRVGA